MKQLLSAFLPWGLMALVTTAGTVMTLIELGKENLPILIAFLICTGLTVLFFILFTKKLASVDVGTPDLEG